MSAGVAFLLRRPQLQDLSDKSGLLMPMLMKTVFRSLLFLTVFGLIQGCSSKVVWAVDKLDKPLERIEQRLEEETKISPSDPNSVTFLRAVGQLPYRAVSPTEMKAKRTLTLDECLQSAFAGNNQIEQARQDILAVGGSKLITNSRFLPAIEIINQYERFRDLDAENDNSHALTATIRQRLLEYGKDNPLDVSLRAEQRDSLINYENQVAGVLSQVRKGFFFIILKEEQIVIRQKLLDGFEKQYERKQQRVKAGNLSVKMEVLTAKLNVLNEQTRINTLKRQKLNRKIDMLRLIGLPVGAMAVEFEGRMDKFALDDFDMDGMILLALAQSSEVALAEAVLAEQQRVVDQLRYEYMPDLRFSGGYQDEKGKIGADLINQNDNWSLDGMAQAKDSHDRQSLGLFGQEMSLNGPDRGWFAGIQIRIPVFEGRAREGSRIKENAQYHRLKAVLDDERDKIELAVRQSYQFLVEQKFQVELAQENVNIERERFSIKEKLRDVGKITDDELETFRRSFFEAQDSLFRQQETLLEFQQDLRTAIRFFK